VKIYINVKQAGVRKQFIARQEFYLEAVPKTLRELITVIVTNNVKNFNNKIDQKFILNYLTAEEINDKLILGKVSFGEINNDKKANLDKALESAFLAYEDGIFRVFVEEQETGSLDDLIDVKEEDVLTFVRLTMLSGRMW
jgi:hypothetical protein